MKIQLYNDDCLNTMSTFGDKSVDMVFTSPPFKEKDMGISLTDYWIWYNSIFNEICRITKKVAVIIHSPTKMNHIIQNYPPKRTMIWGKQTERFYAASWRYNPIFVYEFSDTYNVNKCIWSDTFAIAPIRTQDKIHPYEDPKVLYTSIIKMFKECTSVLDPFMGSGTSGVVCKELNKIYYGIEIDTSIFDLAAERISSA